MKEEKWILLNKKADFAALEQALEIDALTARLLANRGVDTVEKAKAFYFGTPAELPSARLFKDGEACVSLLRQSLAAGEKIAVASDFDADGVFSGMILKQALSGLGGTVRVYTPDRMSEGYGLNLRIVEEAAAWGAGVLLTCDNGIAAHEAVAAAGKCGMKVLITDHHEPPRDGIPQALAAVDPKQEDCPYPYKEICGAAVAFKLMQLLYRELGRAEEELEELIPYASIATVTDVMPLAEENRILVKEGLRLLQESRQPGLRAMLKVTELEGKPLTAYHLGFILGPCFNAAGRLETVETVQRLLEARSLAEALPFAERLKELNNQRKELTNQGRRAAEEAIAREGLEKDRVLVVHLPEIHESVAGIVAGRLREEYARPALVLTGTGDLIKGSGRSIEAYNMYEGLDRVKTLLDRFGGHAMAAGFSLKTENLAEFRRQLNEGCGLSDEDMKETVRLDAVMKPEYATPERIREWEELAPFGKGNDRPLFGQSSLKVCDMKVLGQSRNAVRLRFGTEAGFLYEGIWFGPAEQFEEDIRAALGEKALTALERGQKSITMALAYEPMLHEWNGRTTVQFQIRHYRILGADGRDG